MSTINGKYGRVFNGKSFQDVDPPLSNHHDTNQQPQPIPSTVITNDNKSNTIFVSIPQFRDGKRCAQTLHKLYTSATNPDRVYVGLIEQIDSEESTCLQEYCALMGYKMSHHEAGINKAEKQMDYDNVMNECPRVHDQIRSVRFHSLGAKGPVYARSFVRKLLGNEEFCMQIDAATDFSQGWDTLAIQQWSKTNNEYAVLSNPPLHTTEKQRKEKNGVMNAEVPRQCSIKIGSETVPLFGNSADGKAIGLESPLLSTAYSPSFAFAKCHLETTVPHDPFAVQLLETEKFPHFARLFTRGYDVYTPTVNIVYKDNIILHPLHHTAGHGDDGEKKWPKNDNQRRDAHVRMKILLNIHHGITSSELAMLGGGSGNSIAGKINSARSNLGIYGLGKRRTLDQLLEFTGISLSSSSEGGDQHGNDGEGCVNPKWVAYDASISPKANLYDGLGKANDLDLDPEFPLRTLPDASDNEYDHMSAMSSVVGGDGRSIIASVQQKGRRSSSISTSQEEVSSDVPYSIIFLLWAIGLYVWYGMYVGGSGSTGSSSRSTRMKKGTNRQQARDISRKPPRPLMERTMLKNV